MTSSKSLWHCLGACQAGGTVIDWVMRAEGVSFRHAVELLQNDSLPSAASPIKADLARLLLQYEAPQEQALRAALEVKPAAVTVSETEREAALTVQEPGSAATHCR